MSRSVWLEVALNGPWGRRRQPGIPVTADEIVAEGIACAKAGAAIVHVHAYDEATGRQRDDADIYARIIEGIRAETDAIVYPTIPLAGSADAPQAGSGETRFAALAELARRGLLEWGVVDPGSVNFAHEAEIARDREGFVYLNPESHARAGLALAAEHHFHPSYAIYEPGFLRLGAALKRRYPNAPTPIYRFMFSEGFMFSFPPAEYALEAYYRLLTETAPTAPWMVSGLACDVRPLIPLAVELGGHVRVGLEDAPFGGDMDNLAWVADAASRIRAAGAEPATPAVVRAAMPGGG